MDETKKIDNPVFDFSNLMEENEPDAASDSSEDIDALLAELSVFTDYSPTPNPSEKTEDSQVIPDVPVIDASKAAAIEVEKSEEYEPAEPQEPKKKGKAGLIIGIILLVLALGAAAVFGYYYWEKTADDGKILSNVYIANINLGGMTKADAEAALAPLAAAYTSNSMQIQIDDTLLILDSASYGVSLNTQKILEDAYSYGRSGGRLDYYNAKEAALTKPLNLPVLDYVNMDLAKINSSISDITKELSSTLTQPDVQVLGSRPSLKYDEINEAVSHQTLKIVLGTPGRSIDSAYILDQILSGYRERNFQIFISFPETAPQEVDISSLTKAYCVAPVDAYLAPNSSEIVYEVYGYGFDADKAQELLNSASYGDTIELPFQYIKPAVLGENIRKNFFEDVIFTHYTYTASSEDRLNNMAIACAAINGTVLQPGDVFSFNKAVGERTEEKGYEYAYSHESGALPYELGGGVCQVASTLYYVAMNADLEITERYYHSYAMNCLPMGMDAAVDMASDGDELDFCFRNNTEDPIRIDAEVRDENVVITIRGRDTRKTYVEIEYEILDTTYPEDLYQTFSPADAGDHYDGEILVYGTYGHSVRTYRCVYDKVTKELISREVEAESIYAPHDNVICRIEAPAAPTTPTAPTEDGPISEATPTEPKTEAVG